jgi:hypothetical protein
MTQGQAIEIREHLVNQLNANGFSDIVTEVNTRLEENYEESEFQRNPHNLLTFFLSESIEVLEGLSNKNYEKLLERFNEFTTGDNKVQSISVELLNQGEHVYFNLKDLPNYNDITETFQNILNEIGNEN